MTTAPELSAVGAFAGIGGVELGFARAGIVAHTLIENWEPAREVLRRNFPDATLLGDVRDVTSVPRADVLAGGFPCTDLSQAGRTAGIHGEASGLVKELFRLVPLVEPTWLVVENVRNMLSLDRGLAMQFLTTHLEDRGFRWAYRLVNSQAFGVPQRRHRVLMVASRTEDPRPVLFGDDAGEHSLPDLRTDAFGFYWTEGLRGLGWAQDAVPTLKGGSTIGIASPPGVWHRRGALGRRLLKPRIEDAEAMQGFPRGWTAAVPDDRPRRHGDRWKMVGNAVTVGASAWLGARLVAPGTYDAARDTPLRSGDRWPLAAWGEAGRRFAHDVSMYPVRSDYQHLLDVMRPETADVVTLRGAAGFLDRLDRGSLRVDPEFRVAVKEHVAYLEGRDAASAA
jgi:DNA (cytosine-5)-methyltransferase 1